MKQEMMRWHRSNWSICKQVTTPSPHLFIGWMLFLTPNQQCQSTESNCTSKLKLSKSTFEVCLHVKLLLLNFCLIGFAVSVLYAASISVTWAPGDVTSYIEFLKNMHLSSAIWFPVKATCAFPLVYHYINGIRHLVFISTITTAS